MNGYQEMCLLLVLACLSPSMIQRNLADMSTQPKYKMTFVIWYNNSGDQPLIEEECGKYYAQTFLNSYVRTESLLQNCDQEGRLKVALELKARVKLLGEKIELNTYINVSLVDEGFNNDSYAKILECAQVLNDTLANPQMLQNKHNRNKPQLQHINLLSIPKKVLHQKNKTCERMELNPEAFVYQGGSWVCDNKNHEFVMEQLICMPNYPKTPTTISPSSTYKPKDPNVQETTTLLPINQPWIIQLITNATSSLTLKEGNDPVTLGFKVSVNKTRLCGISQKCTVTVSIHIKANPQDLLKCRSSGKVIPQVVIVKPSWGSKGEVCAFTMDVNVTEQETRYIQLAPMLDSKYDGTQHRDLAFSVRSVIDEDAGPSQKDAVVLPLTIQDEDMKATCNSINDPHIATFDGNQYNNFYEGEFILYEHIYLPYKVHVIYQKCGPGVPASCNCGVAVQSGDDVIVIDRCYRRKKPFNRIIGTYNPYITYMTVDMYLNNNLTPGTTIYEEAEGKKYSIYLPHGGTVKVMVSGQLLNVWVIASPKDKYKTRGLCGTYDEQKSNDFLLSDGNSILYNSSFQGYRLQPREFCVSWRVELYGPHSIFKGVKAQESPSQFPVFCDCTKDYPLCGYAVDVSLCDVLNGKDITKFLIQRAKSPEIAILKKKRSIEDNTISVIPDDPILIDTKFVPPNPSWSNHGWTATTAQQFCSNYVKDKYDIGKLCSQIPAVNFDQEITTCIEDIQITGNTSWANSARDAMKEQCLEEVQRNSSLPKDIALKVQNSICINDCSEHGQCSSGTCHCEIGWTSADCSEDVNEPPYTSEMPAAGLCDTRFMNCKRVIVYGQNFINSENLTCFLQEAEVTDNAKEFSALPEVVKTKALFINFNAVECPIPDLRNYLVRVSNDAEFDRSSDPLLFIPFDSACTTCSTNTTTCTKKKNSCIIDGRCFQENEISPSDPCLVCKPHAHDLEWTTDNGNSCRTSWWENIHIPAWVIALIAAVGGSLIGALLVFIIYKRCVKNKSKKKPHHHGHHNHHNNNHHHQQQQPIDESEADTDTRQEQVEEEDEPSPFEEAMLHRNRGLPTFTSDRFLDIAFQQPDYEHTFNYPHANGIDGVGVGGRQTRVDSTTYF